MPLDSTAIMADRLAELISKRFKVRCMSRIPTTAEKKNIRIVAKLINECGYDPMSTARVFVDFMVPIKGKFRNPRNIKVEWVNFQSETLPSIAHLLPITEHDDRIFDEFNADWEALPTDENRVGFLFTHASNKRKLKITKLYRDTPDYWRLISLIRHYQSADMQATFPLFTLRAFLAAQAETLGSFIDRLKIGNLVSEKAHERYSDWYDRTYYPAELVTKAKRRPSANNPVCENSIRVEYEIQRFNAGAFIGMAVRAGEKALPFYNVPMLYTNAPTTPTEKQVSTSGIVVPPSARD